MTSIVGWFDGIMDGSIQNAFSTTFKYHSLNPKPSKSNQQKKKKNNSLKNDRFFHSDFDDILTISHNILIISVSKIKKTGV